MDADVEALRALETLLRLGMIDQRAEIAIARTVGRTFARLAEWEVAELADTVLKDAPEIDLELLRAVADDLLPVMEQLHSHIWRRHLASAAGRLLVRGSADESVALTVGFVDVVGYTRRTRSMTTDELDQMVEVFEASTTAAVVEGGGRVIKTIGDEVLFVCDQPDAAARVALALAERHDADELFPQVRVGLGHGEVLERYGDVFGEPVNMAARLTSLARPGRVLINRPLADVVDREQFRVRRWRVVPVKGYTRLEAWSLRRPRMSTADADR